MKDEVRWIQRLNNWSKALNQLSRFIAKGELDELQEQGLIQSFEYNHELAWKTQKDFLQERGVAELYGSKDVTRAAFSSGLITNPQAWMDMIADRNLTSHTYNEDVTKKILAHIVDEYYSEFQLLHKKLTNLAEKTLNG
ncbi:MAG: nucleotidyltransferase substrate binding protein [Deltaproteobacteria bacterium]|nr:nucleotidyltransferase substrate binding protein [Deltaproteobacteria bacterium]